MNGGSLFDALIPFQIGINLNAFDVGQGAETEITNPSRPQ